MSVVLIPFKQGSRVKSRLASIVTLEERIELVRCMMGDVGDAIDACPGVEGVLVVSSDPWAAVFARRRGWSVLVERRQTSESDSVDRALTQLASEGVTSVLRLPADVPLVTAGDLEILLSAPLPSPGAILVPSRDGMGTNALLRSPPDAFRSHFGPDSCRIHQRVARQKGVPLTLIPNRQLELDIDTPADLLELARRPGRSETSRLLKSRGIIHRIRERGADVTA